MSKLTQVLEALKKGERVSVQSVLTRFHTTECRKIISRIRQMGYTVKDREVRLADGSWYKEYWLPVELDLFDKI